MVGIVNKMLKEKDETRSIKVKRQGECGLQWSTTARKFYLKTTK